MFLFYKISYDIFLLLCHYNGTIVPVINKTITYNGKSNVLLNATLGMLLMDIKQVVYQGIGWKYNDIEVDITWRCHVGEHQYLPVLISCDMSFRNMIESFI